MDKIGQSAEVYNGLFRSSGQQQMSPMTAASAVQEHFTAEAAEFAENKAEKPLRSRRTRR
jgi:hypothetical protein